MIFHGKEGWKMDENLNSGPEQVHVTITQNYFYFEGSKPIGRKKKIDTEQLFGIVLGVIQLVLVLVK